ncbi:MAG: imidazolonepropionase [Jiangellaceae bacterium]
MPEAPGSTVDLLITGASEVLTCAGEAPDLIGRLPGGGVAVDGGVIVAVGDVSRFRGRRVVDAAGGVVMPGFVDAHTHVVFGGSRVEEYAARVAGSVPPETAPVGIVGTTAATRPLTVAELAAQAGPRVAEMLDHGTTTVESKSGYGLEAKTELRLLEANRELDRTMPLRVVSTYLGAHAFPADTDPRSYVDEVVDTIPEVAERGLAAFCDVYCDAGYFDLTQTRRILQAGLEAGLRPKVHLDAYSHTGAADLAVELGAVSVDHLNYTTPAELEALAGARVVGVYMPCLDYAVSHPRPVDPRVVVDAGIELALATDMCPGCWTTNMQLVIAMACRSGGISVARAIRAATHGAAKALGLEDRVGSLVPGRPADLVVLDVPRHEEIAYRLGRNSVRTVIAAGDVVKGSQQ